MLSGSRRRFPHLKSGSFACGAWLVRLGVRPTSCVRPVALACKCARLPGTGHVQRTGAMGPWQDSDVLVSTYMGSGTVGVASDRSEFTTCNPMVST